jgi:hypothetical protein
LELELNWQQGTCGEDVAVGGRNEASRKVELTLSILPEFESRSSMGLGEDKNVRFGLALNGRGAVCGAHFCNRSLRSFILVYWCPVNSFSMLNLYLYFYNHVSDHQWF